MQGKCMGMDLLKWKNKFKIFQWKYEYRFISRYFKRKEKWNEKWEIYEEKDLY